jgi:Uma2 family endonuclease
MAPTLLATATTDQCIAIHGVSWERYEAFSAAMGESSGVRTTFLEGELEIMSPGLRHEYVNRFLARLVEAFAEAYELPVIAAGSLTIRRKAKLSGVEPDTCYFVGSIQLVRGKPTRPADLAIEVVLTSGTIDKLEVYRRLGVREVWSWEGEKLTVHGLDARGGYRRRRASQVLRGFPLAEAERLIRESDPHDQTRAVREFRESLLG